MIQEAHNGLSAKIVEEAGFKGIWASGLSISASLGVRDCNEASWTQFLDVCEYMNDAVQIPILVDADQGFGNFNNARRFVKKAEQRGIAGICLEDKMFPKVSFCRDTTFDPLSVLIAFLSQSPLLSNCSRLIHSLESIRLWPLLTNSP